MKPVLAKRKVYFDSGSSNSRAYLLDENCAILDRRKSQIGSRDSAIARDRQVLIDGLYSMYRSLLDDNGLTDADVDGVYASGMITTPYGFYELPHLLIPITLNDFAGKLFPYMERSRFFREIILVPGIKTANDDISKVNNMRGEEIEVLGALPRVREIYKDAPIAMAMPGSHTHIVKLRGNLIEDANSNFTGEVFHALKEQTVLAPVLDGDLSDADEEFVRLGVRNLKKFGFTRALYIAHAMRMFENETPIRRFSYAEGVVLGGVSQAMDYALENTWSDVKSAAILATPDIGRLYKWIMSECEGLERVDVLPIGECPSTVMGLKSLLEAGKGL